MDAMTVDLLETLEQYENVDLLDGEYIIPVGDGVLVLITVEDDLYTCETYDTDSEYSDAALYTDSLYQVELFIDSQIYFLA